MRPCTPCACAIKYLFQAGGRGRKDHGTLCSGVRDKAYRPAISVIGRGFLSGDPSCRTKISGLPTAFLLILRVFSTPTKVTRCVQDAMTWASMPCNTYVKICQTPKLPLPRCSTMPFRGLTGSMGYCHSLKHTPLTLVRPSFLGTAPYSSAPAGHSGKGTLVWPVNPSSQCTSFGPTSFPRADDAASLLRR